MIHINKSAAVITLIISAYALISFFFANKIGYYYDEVLYAPSMYSPCSTNSFNYFVIHLVNSCLPALSMGYIGSLKTYVLTPFTILGVSNNFYVYRGVSILFGALSLIFTFKIFKKLEFNFLSSIAVLTLLALNVSFILATTFDWGPVSISIFLITLFVYYSLNFINKVKPNTSIKKLLIIISPLFGIAFIGIFNKVDFVFFLIPFVGSLLLIKDLRLAGQKIIKIHYKIIIILISLGLTFSIAVFYLLSDKISLFLNASTISKLTLGQKLNTFYNVLNGTSVTKVVTSKNINSSFGMLVFLLIVIIIFYAAYISTTKKVKYSVLEKYLLVASLFYYLILFSFAKSGGPHHFIASFPIPFIVFGILVNKVIKQKILQALLVVFIISYTVLNAFNLYKTYSLFKQGLVNASWSLALKDVANFIQQELPENKVYATDWGISNQIIIYSKGKINVQEPFRPISKIESNEVQDYITNIKIDSTSAVRFYNGSVFEDATKNFPYDKYKNTKIFYDRGNPVFIVYY